MYKHNGGKTEAPIKKGTCMVINRSGERETSLSSSPGHGCPTNFGQRACGKRDEMWRGRGGGGVEEGLPQPAFLATVFLSLIVGMKKLKTLCHSRFYVLGIFFFWRGLHFDPRWISTSCLATLKRQGVGEQVN